MKKTAWFPQNVNPIHKGWYEAKCICGGRHYWDGKRWLVESMTEPREPFLWFPMEWRGLVRKPK